MIQSAKSGLCRQAARGSWIASGLFVALAALILVLAGCENRHEGLIDPNGSPPFIRAFRITPDSISLNTLVPSSGQYPIVVFCQAEVTDPDGISSIEDVIADVIPPEGGSPLLSAPLSADSTTAAVGYYSGLVRFSVTKSDMGEYRVVLRSADRLALSGNTVDRRLKIWGTHTPPVLSNLVAPDTIVLPAGDSLLITMSVAVFDSNGLGDVREVYFRSLDSSDPTRKYYLQDNGDLVNYGDRSAGDGIYSIIVRLYDSPTVRKTYRFAFQALDSFADTSATLLHSVTIK